MRARAAAVLTWLRSSWLRLAQPFFLLAVAACAGIAIADALPDWSAGYWLGMVIAAGILLAGRPAMPAVLLLCAAVFAFAHHSNDRDPLRAELAGHVRPGGAITATLTGVITDAPEPDATGATFTFPLRLERLETPLLASPAAGAQLYVRARDFPAKLQYGDRITLTGLLRRPPPPRNPGEFDFPSFLRRQGYTAEFDASAAYDQLTVLERDAGWSVIAAALRSRDWIGKTVTEDIGDDADLAATVRAMVLGTREKTPAEVEDAFIASGAMHVFAVSGLHVAMFCAILWGVLRVLRLRHGWILAIALPAMFFYVFITGLRPSAWRAAIMTSVVVAGPLFNRESNLINSLGAAAVLLLGWDSQQLYQPGFTLSFGVLFALAVLHPWFRRLLRPVCDLDPFLPRQLYTRRQAFWLGVRRIVCDSVSVSLASTIGSAPLMIHYFRILTPVGVIANLFLVTLSLAILAVACASLASAALGQLTLTLCFNHCNWLLALLSVRAAEFFAALPMGNFRCDPARLWRGSPCEITVLGLDYGGAAIHLETPGGKNWLIDTGGRRHFTRTVRPHLSRSPVNRLDGLIISHKDTYHSGAAGDIRRLFRPAQEPALTAGQELNAGEGVRVRCLFPPPGWKMGQADDNCAVFMIECRRTRILVMNDAGFLTEKALLAGGEDLRADVMIKGWHAHDFSGLPEFINAVHPQAVIFPNSPFPSSESAPDTWKAMLAAKGIRLFDQSRSGAVTIRIEQEAVTARGFLDETEIQLKRVP